MSEKSFLFVCKYEAPYGGNFIASLCHLEKHLSSQGVTVYYAFPETVQKREWFSLFHENRHVLFVKPNGTVSLAKQLLSYIDQYGISLLYVHFGYMASARLCALRRKNLKLVLHQHSDFSGGKKVSFMKRIKRFIVNRMDSLLGSRLRQIYIGTTVTKGRNGTIIPNAFTSERFSRETLSREEQRKRMDLTDSDILVILFGWSPYVKGVDIAVDAVHALQQKGKTNIKLAIIGGRDYTEDKMYDWIFTHTQCRQKESWLYYLEPTEDVFRYHKASDIMLSASRSEGFSYSILEALYSGKRCVISNIEGTKWAAKYSSVLSFESENPLDCADVIYDISEKAINPETVASEVQKEYNIQTWTDSVSSILFF